MFDGVGVAEIEEIAECDRRIRVLQARQAAVVSRMYDKRLEFGRRQPAFRIEAGQIAQSVIAEVAMARQVSASAAAAGQFGFALGLRSMTATSRHFAEGRISERVARAVVAEVGGLSAEDADAVDFDLADVLPEMTARKAGAAARQLVLEIDPHASRHAANTARRDRHISIHVLPHSMASIAMRLPATQAVAVYQALDNIAQGIKYEGDARTGSQITCDIAVERLTGQKRADDIAVEIGILMSPGSLLADEDVPALLRGYGPIPAATARQLATGSDHKIPTTAPTRPPTTPKVCARGRTRPNTSPDGRSSPPASAPSGPRRPATPTPHDAPTSAATHPSVTFPTYLTPNGPWNTTWPVFSPSLHSAAANNSADR